MDNWFGFDDVLTGGGVTSSSKSGGGSEVARGKGIALELEAMNWD